MFAYKETFNSIIFVGLLQAKFTAPDVTPWLRPTDAYPNILGIWNQLFATIMLFS